jgi:hypothetical protein
MTVSLESFELGSYVLGVLTPFVVGFVFAAIQLLVRKKK